MSNDPNSEKPTMGWLKLHRRLRQDPEWYSEPLTKAQAWIDLLLMASYESAIRVVKNRRVPVAAGDVLTTQDYLAVQWKWSRGKLLRHLSVLEAKQQIVRRTVHGLTIISICNYDTYQTGTSRGGTANSTASDTGGGTEHGTTGGTTGGTHIKKLNKLKKNASVCARAPSRSPDPISQSQWPERMLDFGFTDVQINARSTVQTYLRWSLSGVSLDDVANAIKQYTDKHSKLPDYVSTLEKPALEKQILRLRNADNPTANLQIVGETR